MAWKYHFFPTAEIMFILLGFKKKRKKKRKKVDLDDSSL